MSKRRHSDSEDSDTSSPSDFIAEPIVVQDVSKDESTSTAGPPITSHTSTSKKHVSFVLPDEERFADFAVPAVPRVNFPIKTPVELARHLSEQPKSQFQTMPSASTHRLLPQPSVRGNVGRRSLTDVPIDVLALSGSPQSQAAMFSESPNTDLQSLQNLVLSLPPVQPTNISLQSLQDLVQSLPPVQPAKNTDLLSLQNLVQSLPPVQPTSTYLQSLQKVVQSDPPVQRTSTDSQSLQKAVQSTPVQRTDTDLPTLRKLVESFSPVPRTDTDLPSLQKVFQSLPPVQRTNTDLVPSLPRPYQILKKAQRDPRHPIEDILDTDLPSLQKVFQSLPPVQRTNTDLVPSLPPYQILKKAQRDPRHPIEDILLCTVCPQLRFSLTSQLYQHYVERHFREYKYVCAKCPAKFRYYCSMEEHIERVHKDYNGSKCLICPAEFISFGDLIQHEQATHVRRTLQSSSTYHNTWPHQLYSQSGFGDAAHTSSTGVPFRAALGGFVRPETITRVPSLQNTAQSFQQPRPDDRLYSYFFRCDICPQRFFSTYELHTHYGLIHPDERKFQCEKCQERFPYHYLLMIHLRSAHSDSNPYKCSMCTTEYSDLKDYLHHERVSHLGYPPL